MIVMVESELMMNIVSQTAGKARAGNAVQTPAQHSGTAGEIEDESAAGL